MRRKRKLCRKGEKADTKGSITYLVTAFLSFFLSFFWLSIPAFINLSKLYDHKDIYINIIFSFFNWSIVAQVTEDEIVGWHYQLNGHAFEQTPGDSEGQGSMAC